ICAKQDLTTAPIQSYLQKLLEEVQLTDEFKLTEEQLIQIAIEENISLADGIKLAFSLYFAVLIRY
ncbi:unnamed protein product, partial [Rotaria socialis]